MANFQTPFGRDAERRSPSLTEQEQGFPCDAADRALFNQLFFRLEAELGHVITHAGLTPTDARFTQVREAIQALIAAATGAGDTSQFLLTAQARARLPIFPEIQTNAGLMGVSSPGVGLVRIPGGVTFLHRGIFPITTAQTDFPTDASKIYHLRWDPVNGYRLLDLDSPAYNPTALADSDVGFDTTYDDMLMARVVTNSSNIATITNLSNKAKLVASFTEVSALATGGRTVIHPVNLARTGVPCLQGVTPPPGSRDSDIHVRVTGNNRYGVTVYSWGWQANTTGAMSSYGYTYVVLGL